MEKSKTRRRKWILHDVRLATLQYWCLHYSLLTSPIEIRKESLRHNIHLSLADIDRYLADMHATDVWDQTKATHFSPEFLGSDWLSVRRVLVCKPNSSRVSSLSLEISDKRRVERYIPVSMLENCWRLWCNLYDSHSTTSAQAYKGSGVGSIILEALWLKMSWICSLEAGTATSLAGERPKQLWYSMPRSLHPLLGYSCWCKERRQIFRFLPNVEGVSRNSEDIMYPRTNWAGQRWKGNNKFPKLVDQRTVDWCE